MYSHNSDFSRWSWAYISRFRFFSTIMWLYLTIHFFFTIVFFWMKYYFKRHLLPVLLLWWWWSLAPRSGLSFLWHTCVWWSCSGGWIVVHFSCGWAEIKALFVSDGIQAWMSRRGIVAFCLQKSITDLCPFFFPFFFFTVSLGFSRTTHGEYFLSFISGQ